MLREADRAKRAAEQHQAVQAPGWDAVWFVVFPKRPPPNARRSTLARAFLHPEWEHCYLLREALPHKTLVVEHVGSHLAADVVAEEPRAFLRRVVEPLTGARVLSFLPAPQPSYPMLRGPLYCVSAVKAALGLRAWWVITPRQLHRHLCRLGAQTFVAHHL